MNKKTILLVLACFLLFFNSGCCVVRTYPVIKERVDQDLTSGNRGYIMGRSQISEDESRKTTRKLQIIEMEIYPIKFGRKSKPGVTPSAYVVPVQETGQAISTPIVVIEPVSKQPVKSKVVVMKKYTVRKRDTLQRISKKFYGTTKRWNEIYEANRKTLKSPQSIYPGQVIQIPIEEIVGVK